MKKLIALFLSALMLLSALPFGVFAEEVHEHDVAPAAEEISEDEAPAEEVPATVLTDRKAEATSGTTGDCTWTLVGTKLTISGNGAMKNYPSSSSLPSWGTSITEVVIENGVTSIGNYAFYNCKSLTSINIPNGVTSIGNSAFENCTSLASITIPDSVTTIDTSAFEDCTSLASIVIPNSVTRIANYTFCNCDSLMLVTIPDSVTSIGIFAFYNGRFPEVWYLGSRSSVSEISIEDWNFLPSDWHYLDSRCDEVCNACEELYPEAHIFDHPCDPDCNKCGKTRTTEHDFGAPCGETCKKCNESRIPDTDHTYGTVADATCDVCGETRPLPFDAYGSTGACDWYRECTVLTVVGSGAMGDYSPFSPSPWSKDITELVIEDGVSVLGADAFSGCAVLTTVTLSETVTTVSDFAFDGCSALACVWLVGDEDSKSLITLGSGNTALTTAAWHYVDNVSDAICNECGTIRTPSDHIFTNACDVTCNVCGFVRSAPNHVYDNACDAACNVCGATRTPTDHVYDSSFDATCNECGFIREALATIDACMSLTVEERIYLNLWLDADDVNAYKAETGEDFTYEAFVTVDGEKKILGSGKVTGEPVESAYGSYYIIRLSALPANYFDQTISVSSPLFTIDTVGDLPLNLLNLAKAGAEAGYDIEKTNLFKAIYNYGASAVGTELLDMGFGFLREQAADPIYGIRAHDAVRFTGMQLLMGDAVGIRLLGKATGDITGLSLGLNLDGASVDDPTYVQNVDEEGNLTLDLYVSAEHYLSLLDLTVSVDSYAVLRLKTSVKGYTEWANKGTDDRTLALAQLVQACINYYADESTLVIPDHTGIETPGEAGEIIF